MPSSSFRDVFITGTGSYLPGEPVSNDEMEEYLGLVGGKPSRLRSRILRSNGIQTRHYALDKQQRTTELNEELAAKAGVTVPLQAAEHYYLLTEPIHGVTAESVPVIEEPESYGYYREEGR